MKNKLTIVKIGGNIIDDEKSLDDLLDAFVLLDNPKILVHGGGNIATKLSDQLGIKTIMNEGRRITSKENLDVVTMVYAGLINKQLTAKLLAKSCNAIGLSGMDANTIQSIKRPVDPIDFGWVGDIESVNFNAIQLFLSNQIIPVFSAIGHDGHGQLLNTNADTIAAEIAIEMSKSYITDLIYCFDKKGVLMNVEDEESVIYNINENDYTELKSRNVINLGMLPKIDNSFYALKNKVSSVYIGGVELITNRNSNCTEITL